MNSGQHRMLQETYTQYDSDEKASCSLQKEEEKCIYFTNYTNIYCKYT